MIPAVIAAGGAVAVAIVTSLVQVGTNTTRIRRALLADLEMRDKLSPDDEQARALLNQVIRQRAMAYHFKQFPRRRTIRRWVSIGLVGYLGSALALLIAYGDKLPSEDGDWWLGARTAAGLGLAGLGWWIFLEATIAVSAELTRQHMAERYGHIYRLPNPDEEARPAGD